MKKTLTTILIFAAVLLAMLALEVLAERLLPDDPATAEEAVAETAAPAQLREGAGEADILLTGEGAHITGIGAIVQGSTVTVAYPGTYHLSGSLTDGQLVVSCSDLPGAVVLVLDGVDIACSSGPAVYVKQAQQTVLELPAGTDNRLVDGNSYVLLEGTRENTGGGIYSADDLLIRGEGALTVTGASADGIRSKDGLTVAGGTVTVKALDDALQGSDYVTVTGGTLTLSCYGDGIKTTEGTVTLSGGSVTVTCAGDGIDSAGDVAVTGGSLAVTACGGAEQYEAITLAGISAKGIKGANVLLAGGAIALNTADDGVRADGYITVADGLVDIISGDDAFHADGKITVTGGSITVNAYEALEAETVEVGGGELVLTAQNNGVDAGTGGFIMTDGALTAEAETPLSSDGALTVAGGTVVLAPSEAGSPLYLKGAVIGGTAVLLGSGTEAELTADGTLEASFLCLFPTGLTAGTDLTVTDEAGREVLAVTVDRDCTAALVSSGAMAVGQTYTVTAGTYTMTAPLTEDCTTLQSITAGAAFGNAGGPSGNMGGASRGPMG